MSEGDPRKGECVMDECTKPTTKNEILNISVPFCKDHYEEWGNDDNEMGVKPSEDAND